MSYDEFTPRAFICSTQKDLLHEREIASRLCVFRDVLPQSMEQFSSSDQTQWDFIELILKKCDFVIILLGGRYGSINLSDSEKRSYTECEYLFAVQERIPILRFVQDMSDGAILDANDDADDKAEAAKRMKAFRALVVKDRLSAKWASRDEFITKLGVAIDEQRRKAEKRFIESKTSMISKLELDHCRAELGQIIANSQRVTVRSTSNDFDHTAHIEKSQTVKIIMNDGFRFFEKYRAAFERRVAAGSPRTTEVCLMAPDGPHLETVSRRSEKTPDEQRKNILRSEKLVHELFAGAADSSLNKLHLMKNFFPYCLFQYDDLIITSVYFNFLREEELPMYLHPRTDNPSHVHFQLLKNTDKLFRRAGSGDAAWFHHRQT